MPITLTLASNSGTTGVANFSDTNTTTKTITQTTTVQIKGIIESSTNDNMRLKATYNNNGNDQQLDDEDFTVISIQLSLKYAKQVSDDNSKRANYNTYLGTYNLGVPFLSNGTQSHLWRIGIEIKGTVLPTNFTENLVLDREMVSLGNYRRENFTTNWVSYTSCPTINPPQPPPCPDMSDAVLIDNTPSTIYDLDAPGTYFDDNTAQVGRAARLRYNFRQWVTISQKNGSNSVVPVRVSEDINWYFRLSIIKTAPGMIEVLSDVPADNQVGSGTTSTNLNL